MNDYEHSSLQEDEFINTSGQGAQAIVPMEIRGWSWAAFLLGPIWSIVHHVWIGLLCFVPYVGIIMYFVLGIKGNEWGWQNRRFESIEQYKTVQKIWTYWGIAIIIIGIVINILLGTIAHLVSRF